MDEMARMKKLGERIRTAREHLGLSQEKLAFRWGKQQYQISEYENGNRRVYAHDLPELARILQVNISYFFQDEADDSETDLLEETLVHIYRNLQSRSAQEFAVNVLQELRTMMARRDASDS